MNKHFLRGAALTLASTAQAWAHGDPGTHFHASHGAGTLAGAVFVGALAGCALIALAQAVSAWRRRRAGRAA
jgi:hypothetical protein